MYQTSENVLIFATAGMSMLGVDPYFMKEGLSVGMIPSCHEIVDISQNILLNILGHSMEHSRTF